MPRPKRPTSADIAERVLNTNGAERPRQRRPIAYLPPPLKGKGEYDRRAATLDAAATAFLKSAGKAGRTHKRSYDNADRRAVRWSGPDMAPNETLTRNGGQRLTGVRMHGTGRF